MGSVLVAEAFVSVLELLGYGECAGCICVCWRLGCRGICECVGVIGGSVLVAEVFVSVLELLGYGECAGCRGI